MCVDNGKGCTLLSPHILSLYDIPAHDISVGQHAETLHKRVQRSHQYSPTHMREQYFCGNLHFFHPDSHKVRIHEKSLASLRTDSSTSNHTHTHTYSQYLVAWAQNKMKSFTVKTDQGSQHNSPVFVLGVSEQPTDGAERLPPYPFSWWNAQRIKRISRTESKKVKQ